MSEEIKVEALEISSNTGDKFIDKACDALVAIAPPGDDLLAADDQIEASIALIRVGLESLLIASSADVPGVHTVLSGLFQEISESYKDEYMARPDGIAARLSELEGGGLGSK